MFDLLMVFPPQWSAFQPALSLPSLSAWLKRAGFNVRSLDLNLHFYEWLFTETCTDYLLHLVDQRDWSPEVKQAYRTAFLNANEFREDVQNLKRFNSTITPPRKADYFEQHYIMVRSLETYLTAISQVSQDIFISPYAFHLTGGNLKTSELERLVDSPPPLLVKFLSAAIVDYIAPHNPKSIGISCIGQEQLYFTLLLGSLLKQHMNVPVFVGGTILSRIFERGALKPQWFERFFDVIVRNEGERPAERLLSNLLSGRPLFEGTPGIVYLDGQEMVSSPPCPPLQSSEIPLPDFDDLPIESYLSAEATLPLLSSRGCYWGKCEFCHHGMVYGEKYEGSDVHRVLETVESLSEKYHVRHFAFNDEAIPPKILRSMGKIFPPCKDTGWSFTGLIKFENYFQESDFANIHRIGFRSLYVGLESASERVLRLMRKNTLKDVIVRNLTDATSSGIWMHCFLFFGFPGETESDAQETYDFVLANPDIINSFGAGTFSLEHNAPIFRHLEDFGLQLRPSSENDIDVYYDYIVSNGVTPDRALEWMLNLNKAALTVPSYRSAGWIPRELQLCMLSVMAPHELVAHGLRIYSMQGLPEHAVLPQVVSRLDYPSNEACQIVVNRLNGRALAIKGNAAALFDACYENRLAIEQIRELAPMLFDRLRLPDDVSSSAVLELALAV
jgi:anaerobic magnesium-protoporphyrin IX monomethyl ester cyclase